MINKAIVGILIVLGPVIVQGENLTTSNEIGTVCSIASNTNMGVCQDNMSNGSVTSLVADDFKNGQPRGPEQGSFTNVIKKTWLFIGSIILLFVSLIDWCSKHAIWKFLVQAVKWIAQHVDLRSGKESTQRSISQKVGNQNIEIGNIVCGNNAKVSIGIAQSPKQHNNVVDKTGDRKEAEAHEPSAKRQSEQQLRWDEIEKKFNPYRQIKVNKTTIRQIVEANLSTTDMLRARCPKGNIPICVIDDRDNEKYRDGLKTLGYENVTIYSKCPAYEALKPFAIVIFDVKGVGNAAGKDGFLLAVNFKVECPLKMVGVRSAYLQGVPEGDRAKLDFAIEKNRDLCEQVAPILNEALKEVGDPVVLWKKACGALIKTVSVKELALLEHEYVNAICLLSNETDVLPGDWMAGVNRLLNRNIF